MDKLKEEETKGKDMLDEKIKLNNEVNQLKEDLNEAKMLLKKRKEELIKL